MGARDDSALYINVIIESPEANLLVIKEELLKVWMTFSGSPEMQKIHNSAIEASWNIPLKWFCAT